MIKGGRKILFFIQLPPPVHGVSITNEQVYNSTIINQNLNSQIVQIKFSEDINELRKFSLLKLRIFFKTIIQLNYTLLKFRPDIVYFSLMPVGIGFLRDALFAILIKMFRKKIVFHLNNRGIPYYNKKFLFYFLYTIVFRNSTIIHVSNKLLESEILPLKIKGIRTYVVGNTISSSEVPPKDYESQNMSILFLSNYFPEKGLMFLLKAFKTLIDKYPQIRLNAYGASQSYVEDLKYQSFIKINNLEGSIFIHGPVYGIEKKKVFEENDLFVFPSYFREECFPLSILEAMNARLPIIATKIGAIPEMIEDNMEGLLIDPGNPNQIIEKLVLLLNNVELRQILGNNAHNKFKEHYSLPVFEEKMKAIFQQEFN